MESEPEPELRLSETTFTSGRAEESLSSSSRSRES